ncbi:hypothetical protein [Cyclobacterium jeungdonense]|uniref:Uncharacterized protein n=1 Tax=Cyclobacterium jeungdonense TaxID=708087 RepID=A0ABT8CBE3_9BACT|nr:hypothetical protein [Cyclobacterium jeungdonense]MDN3689070.1 hypothetical protein [Cyclobacterium jeungdonense]
MNDLMPISIAFMMVLSAFTVIVLIAFIVRRMISIQTIEELTVAFPETMRMDDRKQRLLQAIADKEDQLHKQYPPEKIRSLDGYIFSQGNEYELDLNRLRDLDHADFVHIQYVILK